MIDLQTVEKMARLSRLDLTSSEKSDTIDQLNKIVAYVEQLQSVDTEGVKPTAYVVPDSDRLRDDVAHKSLSPQDALLNAPVETNGYFAVPKVIG